MLTKTPAAAPSNADLLAPDTTGLNFYRADPMLAGILRLYLPKALFDHIEIFCVGIFLGFAGHFLLGELSGGALMHLAVSLGGIVTMTAVAWLLAWYKSNADKNAPPSAIGADLVGGKS